MINLTINGKNEEFAEETSILEASKTLGIKIPTLCNNEFIKPYGGCRLCLIEVSTERAPDAFRMLPACCTKIDKGLTIKTHSERVKKARVFILQLLLARTSDSEEIIALGKELGAIVEDSELDPVGNYLLNRTEKPFDTKCILCGLCVRVCAEVTERHAISFFKRGMEKEVKIPFNKVAESCIGCGSCAYVCPTNTIVIEEVS
ncbi:MAG: 2Fe-2S iron-sulfur cluster-binding protein [Spirochaetaceae bacterium]|jgi:bidirectional [NiFe] hydrogenase diaphorase subunit|nr:2Fe-2S iron-sulfur cluster-binding protein [Spirochaetaceae bacterium]